MVEWLYCQNIHRSESIETLAHSFRNKLQLLIEHCTSADRLYSTSALGYTPSDFPDIALSQAEIEGLMEELSEEDE